MNISVEVTGNILEYLENKVKAGLYKSRGEVVREAIREMIRREIKEKMEIKGLTPAKFEQIREEVAGELIEKKYKGKI